MDDDQLTVEAARSAATEDLLGEWVMAFLASPGSDNELLGQELFAQNHHWLGPVQVPLDELNRFAGPSGDPVVVPVDDDYWDDRVDDLAEKLEDGFEPAPLVVTYRDGKLHLEDGNHRVESLRRSGESTGSAVIGFEDSEQLDHFADTLADSGTDPTT